MIPAWFDADYYGQQKVLQMNKLSYEPEWLAERGAKEWTFELYEDYLDAYRLPDGSSVSAWDNFLACNGSNYPAGFDQTAINISCNPLFDVNYYCQSLVNWANGIGNYSWGYVQSGQWTAESMLAHLANDLGLSLWEHFKTIGLREQLNPSENFDTHAYLVARAEKMSANGQEASIEDAMDALLAENANPLMDYYDYGKAHQIKITPVVSTPAIPEPPSTVPDNSAGSGNNGQTPPSGSKPDNKPEDGKPAPGEDQPGGTPGADDSEKPNPDDTEENPGDTGDRPDQGDTEEKPDSPYTLVIEQEGDVTIPAIKSNGENISVSIDVTGQIGLTELNAAGTGESGNIDLNILAGKMGSGLDKAVLTGENITVQAQINEGYPSFELWASGSTTYAASETEAVDDRVAARDPGSGVSSYSLGNGHDIFQLFDISHTCKPANMLASSQISVDLGICRDQLYIGDLAVQNGATQTISVDLGKDYEAEIISLGKVTAGKLIVSMTNCNEYDQITGRDVNPKVFGNSAEASAALKAFGIDAENVELDVWRDRVFTDKLIETEYDNAAIGANGQTYVIYGENCLLELDFSLQDYEDVFRPAPGA